MKSRVNLLMLAVLFLSLVVAGLAYPGYCNAQPTVKVRGLIDIVAQGENDLLYLNYTNLQDSNFDPLRARIFIEGGTNRTQFFIQTLFSQESFSTFRLFGAYLLHKVVESQEIYFEVGLIPVHDGIWAPHTYSNKNPLIGVPLAYYWKSNLHPRQMPVDLDQLLEQRGQGQFGVEYYDSTGVRGSFFHSMPILYDNCWNYGLYSLGTVKNMEYAVGVTVGAPGAPIQSTDTNDNLALHAKIGYAVTPGFKLYVSGAQGAYLSRDVVPYLPAGASINDFMQTLFVVSMDWQWRYISTMGEVFFNHFETPIRSEGLRNQSFYLQTAYKFLPGWYVAGRYDEIRHEEVDSNGSTLTWDYDVKRVEAGLGYHFSREMLGKLVVQGTNQGIGFRDDTIITAIQLSYAF